MKQNDVVRGVARKAAALAEMLNQLASLKHVGEIRQKGFMVGVELVAEKATRRPFDPKRRIGAEVCARVRKRGVILRPLGDVIVVMPPPAMALDDLAKIVRALLDELRFIT
jgi:adenosylmethionine-8-amino-7-oxononanoate aminotransferase